MAVIDSYSESNQTAASSVATGASGTAFAQCFTGDGQKIVSSRFYIAKHSVPTGNAVSKIYTMTGTFGTNGDVGTVLATSDNVDVSTLGAAALVTFSFSGAQQYTTTNGTHYVVSMEFTGGNGANYLDLYYDATGTHPGTWTFRNDSGVWTPTDAGLDFCFYVDGVAAAAAANSQFLQFC